MADTPSSSDIQNLTDSINRLAGGNSQPKAAPSASSGGGSMSDGGVVDTFTKIAKAGVPVYTAFENIGRTSGYVEGGLAAMAKHLPVGGEAVGSFVKSLGDARQQNLANSQIGIGGNALFDLAAKAGKLGLSQDEYRQIIQSSNGALAGLGGNAQQGSERLLKLGSDVQSVSNEGKRLVEANRMTQAELTQLAVISQYGSKANLDDVNTRKQATQAAGLLASEVYKQAQITGKSTTAIEQELSERLRQPEVMAQMRLMSEDQRQSFIRGQAAITGLGKDAGDLGAVLARGGRLTEDNQKQLMAMGPAAGEFQRAMRMTALAQTDDQRRQAAEAVERAKAHVTAFQSSQQFANMMSNASPEMAKYYRQQYEQNQLREKSLAQQREGGGTILQAQRGQARDVGLATGGLKREAATGKVTKDTSQELSRAVGEAELKGAAGANAMRTEVANLNNEFGKSPKAIQGFRSAMDAAFGPTGDVAQAQKNIKNFGSTVVDALGGNIKPAGKMPEKGAGAVGVPLEPPKKHAMGGEIPEGKSGIVGDGGPELIKGPANVTSISETASMIKNAVKENSAGPAGSLDLAKIGETINTTISAASPKSEVPTKSPELIKNEELKAKAEEALKIIKDAGEGSFETNIRITKNGNLRLTEQFEEGNDRFQSLGQESAEQRIAELVAQADKIKARQTQVGEQKAAVEESQLAKESVATSARQQNLEKAYAAMKEMDPTSMYADLGRLSAEANESLIEDKKASILEEASIPKPEITYDEFGTEIPKKPAEPVTPSTEKPEPAVAKPAEPEKTEPSALDTIKSKFSGMFESFKLPELLKPLTDAKPPVIEPPKAPVEIKQPMRTIVPPTPPVAPKLKVEAPKPKAESAPKPAIHPTGNATLDDVTRLLEQLNKTMAQVASHSENISESSHKAAKNSSKASGNKNYA